MVSEPDLQYSQSPQYQDNPILKKSFEFALSIIDFTEGLFENKKFVIGQQLLKSGTSVGANIREAQNAESKADFVHKMKIALKEADETDYWLLLCNASSHYPDTTELLKDLKIILRILNKIVATAKQNLKSK
ncbi:MAG: four helix bundle protein [Flavobacteriales bacterium]|nr:four helix bundle protein [Flavobacteriales bacterium]